MTNAIKVTTLFFMLNMAWACSGQQSHHNHAAGTQNAEAAVTIHGIVRAVTFGKDGYTAEVLTDAAGTCSALVSIVNVGGRENYKSCEVGDKVSFKGIPSMVGGAQQLKVIEIISVEPAQTQMLIGPNAFRGIQVGDPITKHQEYTQKTKLKTGEGTFEVFEIKDFDNNPAGYFLPDPNDKHLVGNITVTSPKARTVKGIKIGDTFADLLKVFPDIAVHGSEMEGRTHATAHNLSYRLDVANFSYETDRAKVPATARIIEITINRK